MKGKWAREQIDALDEQIRTLKIELTTLSMGIEWVNASLLNCPRCKHKTLNVKVITYEGDVPTNWSSEQYSYIEGSTKESYQCLTCGCVWVEEQKLDTRVIVPPSRIINKKGGKE